MKTDRLALLFLLALGVVSLLTGNVFEVGPQAQGQPPAAPPTLVLYSFGGHSNDPKYINEIGLVAEGPDGNLYGTSPNGGAKNDQGTIFKITPDGHLEVRYDFDFTLGRAPKSGLTLGSDGNFYGTTYDGGKYWVGTIFKIAPGDKTPTTVYDFRNGRVDPAPIGRQPTDEEKLDAAAAYPISAPVQGKDGNFYGVTPIANNVGTGVLYTIPPSGKYRGLHLFKGDAGLYPVSLIAGNDGNLYGAALVGPVWGQGATYGCIFKATPAGAVSLLYPFDLKTGAYPHSLIQSKDGNLYGTTAFGGKYNMGVVYKLTLSGDITILHEFNGPDGIRPEGGIVQGTDGYLYGSTVTGGPSAASLGVVYRIAPDGKGFRVLHPFNGPTGAWSGASLMQHSNGNIYGAVYEGGDHNLGGVYRLDTCHPGEDLPAGVDQRPVFSSTPKTRPYGDNDPYVEVKTHIDASASPGLAYLTDKQRQQFKDGITIRVKDRENAHVVQFVYREMIGADGKLLWGDAQPVSGPCSTDPHNCYQFTTDPKNPNWVTDTPPPNPYMDRARGTSKRIDCDGLTYFDAPSFTPPVYVEGGSVGPHQTWYFEAKAYAIFKGKVVREITWTLQRKSSAGAEQEYDVAIRPITDNALPSPFPAILAKNNYFPVP